MAGQVPAFDARLSSGSRRPKRLFLLTKSSNKFLPQSQPCWSATGPGMIVVSAVVIRAAGILLSAFDVVKDAFGKRLWLARRYSASRSRK